MLYYFVEDLYKEEGLRLLAKDLGHDYENLAGRITALKAKSLVERLAVERRLIELFDRVDKDFPARPLSDYFFELPVSLFLVKPIDLDKLLDPLGLTIRDIGEYEVLAHDSAKWLLDTARALQKEMAETGRWDALLTEYARLDDKVELAQLQRLFPAPRQQAGQRVEEKQSGSPADTNCFLPFLQLDYEEQVDTFGDIDLDDICAFVVYGLPDQRSQETSLRLLLKKLLNRLPENIPRMAFSPASTTANDADGVWNEVARSVGIDPYSLDIPISDDDQDKIVAAVHNRVTSSQFILILERLNDAFAADLLVNFWLPFARKLRGLDREKAEKASLTPSANGDRANSKVLLFLVDTDGLLHQATIHETSLDEYTPVELPRIKLFDSKALQGWKRVALDHPNTDERLKSMMRPKEWDQEIIAPPLGDGLGVKPDKALRYVCKKCRYDYGGAFIEWLKGESKIAN